MRVNKNINNQKGITLISLVITVIVILILAGISIRYAVGENEGLLVKTNQVAEKHVIAKATEDITSAWGSAKIDYNKSRTHFSTDQMQEYLTDKDNINVFLEEKGVVKENPTYDETTGKYTVVYYPYNENVQITVQFSGSSVPSGPSNPLGPSDPLGSSGSGSVVVIGATPIPEKTTEDTNFIKTPTNKNKYGWKVNGYTSTEYNGVWRLFYQDSNNTYIIAEPSDNKNFNPSDFYTVYSSGADVSEEGQNLNYKLKEDGNFFTTSNTSNNLRATAWLTDTSSTSTWSTKYKDAGGMAQYAIGAPTYELYIASFNATHHDKNIPIVVESYGYKYDGTVGMDVTGVLGPASDYHGIYNCGIEPEKGWRFWLASPDSTDPDQGIGVIGNYRKYLLRYNVTWADLYVRPVVCIPTITFNRTLLDRLTNE